MITQYGAAQVQRRLGQARGGRNKNALAPTLTRQHDVYPEAGDHDHLIHMGMKQYLSRVRHAKWRELC